jgi:hypothetical protein
MKAIDNNDATGHPYAAANKPQNIKKQPKNGPKSTSISAPVQSQQQTYQQVTDI